MKFAISLDLCFVQGMRGLPVRYSIGLTGLQARILGPCFRMGLSRCLVACPVAVKRGGCVLDLSLQLIVSHALIHFGWGGPKILGHRSRSAPLGNMLQVDILPSLQMHYRSGALAHLLSSLIVLLQAVANEGLVSWAVDAGLR